MQDERNLFIQMKGIGFIFLIDKRMKHNLISPAFLAFFHLGERQMYSLSENNIREVNTKPAYDNFRPFLPNYVDSISTKSALMMCSIMLGRKWEDVRTTS